MSPTDNLRPDMYISIKLLKLVPIPAKYVTVGTTTRNSSKVYGFEYFDFLGFLFL